MTHKIAVDRKTGVMFDEIRWGSIFEYQGAVFIKIADDKGIDLANGGDYHFVKGDVVEDCPPGTEITIEIRED